MYQATPTPIVGQSHQARETFICVITLLVVILSGTVGFLLIEEDWGLWKSLFFTLITITTVGYGDKGLSSSGEVFASVLLIVGIATATYSFSTLVRIAVSRQLAWRRKMQKQIDQLEDHFVICGFGRIGRTVCEQLYNGNVPFVVIESEQAGYEDALNRGYLAIQGNSTDDELLTQAGMQRAAGVVCVVNSDAENVFIALSARELNPQAFIASRADADGAARKIERAGASLVVSPYTSAGARIATAILRPHLTEFLQHGHRSDDGIELSEITVEPGSVLCGQSIRDFGIREPSIVFVAIKRDHGKMLLRPGGSEVFSSGDVVIVASRPDDLSRMYKISRSAHSSEIEAELVAS